MAEGGDRNMLFDIRGRRRRVIQVVYAGLAFLMAASLITVLGPGIGGLGGGGGGGSDASELADEQVQRLERKLKRNPDDESALVQLTQARFQAGNAKLERDANSQVTRIPEEAITDFDEAGETFQRYLKTDPQKPNATAATLAAQSLFYVAQASTAAEFQDNIEAAAAAQAVYAEAEPTVNSYLTLAQYRYFAGDEAGAEEAARRAQAEVPQSQRATVKASLDQARKVGEQVQKQIKAASKFQPGGGEEALQNPLGGLSGGGTGTSAPAP